MKRPSPKVVAATGAFAFGIVLVVSIGQAVYIANSGNGDKPSTSKKRLPGFGTERKRDIVRAWLHDNLDKPEWEEVRWGGWEETDPHEVALVLKYRTSGHIRTDLFYVHKNGKVSHRVQGVPQYMFDSDPFDDNPE